MKGIIDYSEIDEHCVGLVRYFNEIGLTTKYCCSGHAAGDTYYIMLADDVQDDKVEDFLMRVWGYAKYNKYFYPSGRFEFSRWSRIFDDGIRRNWMFKIRTPYPVSWKTADEILDSFEKNLN